MNIIAKSILIQSRDVAMAGILMIGSSIANSTMRSVTNNVIETMVRDIRRARNGIKERRQEQ